MYKRAYDAGVTKILEVGLNIESTRKAIYYAEHYEYVYASAGIHPSYAQSYNEEDLDALREFTQHDKVVAVGELGLDATYDVPLEDQQRALHGQIALARELHMPIIIHQRDTDKQFIDYLSSGILDDVSGVFHCFSGSAELAKKAVDLGFYLSFAGQVTFKNYKKLDIFPVVPLENILIETDSPYLSPEPLRGKRNEPSNIKYTAEKLAHIYNLSKEEFSSITYNNAQRLFNLQ